MRGKIAFVLGAAAGYVLGARAGRERYEQIKRGAQHLWQTEPVQRGVSAVKDAVDERADVVKVFVARVGADVLSGFAQPKQRPSAARSAGGGRSEADAPTSTGESTSDATDAATEATTSKQSAAKSESAKAKGAKTTGAKSKGSGAERGTKAAS